MDPYSTPYVSIVPRLLPSQYSSKKFAMSDEGYEYVDNRPISSFVSPQNHPINGQSLTSRNNLNQQDLNHQINNQSLTIRNNLNQQDQNQPFYSNSQENISKGRNKLDKTRLHHEALKDNSGDTYSSNPYNGYNGYIYPPNSDYNKFYENSPENKSSKSSKILIIIFGIFIGLFALTALAISIYLLIKMSSSSSSTTTG